MQLRIRKDSLKLILLFVGVIGLFILVSSLIDAPSTGSDGRGINLFGVFLIGLLTGGLTCLAVQGGLLAATLAQREEERLTEHAKESGNAVPILSFLMTKLLAYTLLGMLLGWVGSLFTLSLGSMGILQIAVALFMLGTALNMLDVHPIFRYFVIQPPRFLTRFVRKQSKSKDLFAPGLVGALTVFIPCGTTQAMMALAIASANPWMGTLIMFSFVLGTSPIFFILGYFTTKLSGALHEKFLKVAAVLIIFLSVFTINNALLLMGSKVTFQNALAAMSQNRDDPDIRPVNEATITINSVGYSPQEFAVKAGSKVKINLVNTDGIGCQQAFTIPQLRFQKMVRPGETYSFDLQMPQTKGDISYMCSMGMFTGVIRVI